MADAALHTAQLAVIATTDPAPVPPVDPVKFSIDPAALKAAYAKLKTAVYKHGAAELTRIHVVATDGRVSLTATDIDRTVTVRVDADVETAGEVLVPADLVDKMITKVKPTVPVDVTLDAEGGKVRAGRLALTFDHLAVKGFPVTPKVEGRTIELDLAAVAEVLPATSPDESRPILTGIEVKGGTYAATDSYRIAAVYTGTATGDPFLFPRAAATLAVKHAKGKVTAVVGDRHIEVELDEDTTLISRLIEGQFPPYEKLIPEGQPHELVFTDDFRAALKDAMGVVPDKDEYLSVIPIADGIRLKLGIVEADIAGTVPFQIGFTPRYLAASLAGFKSNRLGVTDTLGPVAGVEPAPEFGEGAKRVRVLMPVRVS